MSKIYTTDSNGNLLFQRLPLNNPPKPYKIKQNFTDYGEGIIVGDSCIESYPCWHDMKDEDGKEYEAHGTTIAKMFVDKGLEVPEHFQGYVNFKGFTG
jgi:hypothetical protein